MPQLPIIAFMTVYFLFCIVGALIICFNIQPLTAIYIQHAGFIPPNLSQTQLKMFLSILFEGPFFLIIGYLFALKISQNTISKINIREFRVSHKNISLLFYLLFFIAVYNLSISDAFLHLQSWLNYEHWVKARWNLYKNLSFFEFVNIYRWLPIIATLLLLYEPISRLGKILKFLPIILTIIIDFLLYQKTHILLTIATGCFAMVLHQKLGNKESKKYNICNIFILAFIMISIYLSIVIIPTLHSTNKDAYQSISNNLYSNIHFDNNKNTKKSTQVIPNEKKIEYNPQYELSPLKYSLFTLVFRLSGIELLYSKLFPDEVPYYNLDIGQDILGFGNMPDDNYVIWNAMYPGKEGCASGPMNFVFYSQGGLLTVRIGMFIVGFILGIAWSFVLFSQGSLQLRTIIGTIILLFSLQIPMDSLRNLVVCSYGYLWSITIVGVLYLIHFKTRASKPLQTIITSGG